MNSNPSDNLAKQPSPSDSQLEHVTVAPPAAPQAEDELPIHSTEERATVPAANQSAPTNNVMESVSLEKPTVHTPPVTTVQERVPASPVELGAEKPITAPEEKTVALQLADDTLSHKTSNNTDQQTIVTQALPDVENPYILSG